MTTTTTTTTTAAVTETTDVTGRLVTCNGLGGRITYHDPRGLVRVSHDDGEMRDYTLRVGHGYHLRGHAPGLGMEATARATNLVILPRTIDADMA